MPPDKRSDLLESTSPPFSASGGILAKGYDALSSTARKILSEENLPPVLQIICEEACRIFGAESSLIAQIFLEDAPGCTVLHAQNLATGNLEAIQTWHGRSIMVDVCKSGEVKITHDLKHDLRTVGTTAVSNENHRTLCAIPLSINDEPFMVLLVNHLIRKEYTHQEREFASWIGQLGSLAIERVRLLGSVESRVDEQRSLGRALKHVASGESVDEIIQAVLAESELVMGTDRCSVMLPDEVSGEPRNLVSKGISLEFHKRMDSLPVPNPIGRAYLADPKHKEPTIIPDLVSEPHFGPIHAQEGHLTLAAFPLRVGERNIGALFFYWTSQQKIEEQRIFLGQAVADQVAISLEKTKMLSEAQQRSSRLEIVEKIARVVGSTLKPDELFRTIVREIRGTIPCDRCVIAGVSPSSHAYFYWHVESDVELGPRKADDQEVGEWFIGEVYENNRVRNIPDINENSLSWSAHLTKAGLRSMLIVPILQGKKCIAHLTLTSRKAGAFTSDQEVLLTSISSHLGTALRNATLFQEAEKRAFRQATLNRLNKNISENLNLSEVLGRITGAAVELLNCDHSRIFLLDEEAGELNLWPDSRAVLDPTAPNTIKLGEGITGRMVQTFEPVIVPDVQEEALWVSPEYVR
ncbi:MAG: GAF domain-containing protein, partial [Nitrososphaerales archaeon]